MSAFSHTDWTVVCNGFDGPEYWQQCPAQGRTAVGGTTAREVRAILKKRGWAVNVPVQDERQRVRRLDFCPKHKKRAEMTAAKAGKG